MFQLEQFQFKNFKILISIFLKGPDFLNHKMFIRMKNMPVVAELKWNFLFFFIAHLPCEQ